MLKKLASFLTMIGLVAFLPLSASAVTLVTCPDVGDPERVFGIDTETLSSGNVACYAYGPGNNLTGGESDDFLASHPDLTFFDYDNDAGQGDNEFWYSELGDSPLLDGFVYGAFQFGAAYTDSNGLLYLGFKVGNNLDPAWAVFEFSNFDVGEALTGNWYIAPKQGSGISHAAIYGDGDVPPGVEPDPAVPEPASLMLLGTGLAAAAAASRRRRKVR